MNKYLLPLLLLAGLCSGCLWDPDGKCTTDLSLRFTTTVSPARDTFRIGDTLWVESVVPDTLQDFKSGIRYDATEINTAMNFTFEEEMVADSFFAERFFRVLELDHNVDTLFFQEINSNPLPLSFRVGYVRPAGTTRFKVGFIPTKAGLFGIQMSFYKDDYEKIDLDPDCIDVVRDVEITTNGGQSNYHLFNGFVPYPYDSTGFRMRGGFAFRVVE
jgi:hypothetical protein